jgi:hypothetical protein
MLQNPGMDSEVADRLLDAQVGWVLRELSGKRFAKVVARDVDDVLAVAGTLIVRDLVDPDAVKQAARHLVDTAGSAPIVADLVVALADAIYDLAASDEHRLGDVVERDPVVALIAKVLSITTLRERALDRLGESAMATAVAVQFAGKIVGDIVAQNRAKAERVPGARSLISFGTSAASRVKSVSDRALDPLIGDATARGKVVALKATTNATRELINDGLLQEAALELWDLHADEPISALRGYLGKHDLRELAQIVREIVVTARNKDYVGHVLDACIDVFFERYGDLDVAALLDLAGVDREHVVDQIVTFGAPVIEAAKADGVLAEQVRRRLEPFYRSKAFETALAAPAARKPSPTKRA